MTFDYGKGWRLWQQVEGPQGPVVAELDWPQPQFNVPYGAVYCVDDVMRCLAGEISGGAEEFGAASRRGVRGRSGVEGFRGKGRGAGGIAVAGSVVGVELRLVSLAEAFDLEVLKADPVLGVFGAVVALDADLIVAGRRQLAPIRGVELVLALGPVLGFPRVGGDNEAQAHALGGHGLAAGNNVEIAVN